LSEEELRSIIREELRNSIDEFFEKHVKELFESYPSEDKIINSVQAAKFLGVSRVTLAAWIKNESVPYRREGKRLLFSKRDLLIWVREGSRFRNRKQK
jgi:excisionase family DNA binding protein